MNTTLVESKPASPISDERDDSPTFEAIILHDYEATEPDEISLQTGDVIRRIKMISDDWWYGFKDDGTSGHFPANHVNIIDGSVAESSPKIDTPSPATFMHEATVIFKYCPSKTDDGCVAVNIGDVVTDVLQVDAEWSEVTTMDSRRGYVPTSFLEFPADND